METAGSRCGREGSRSISVCEGVKYHLPTLHTRERRFDKAMDMAQTLSAP